MITLFLILIGIIILLCIWLNNVSARIGIPTLLAFIVLGMIFGNNGLVPLHFEDHVFAKETCTVALIFIMFYGGFGTRWGWGDSFLLGSVVSSTDAASVFSILRSKKLGLRNNTAPILEMESGSNDPFAYMLTALMLSIMNGNATGIGISWMLFAQLAFGAGCGIGIAKLASWILERFRIKGEGYDSLFIFSVAILSYAIPDLIGGNGYLSAYIVGIMLGNSDFPGKKALVNFFDGVTGLMQVLIFFLLGLLARPLFLHRAILPALAIFSFMLLVARPLSVMGILTPLENYPERVWSCSSAEMGRISYLLERLVHSLGTFWSF